MRILDVQDFKTDQYENYRERRTSQFIRFLDKDVDFVTYYQINKNLSTTEYGNNNIDSYIGEDSPVRYNKINNLPVYGIPVIDQRNEYDIDNLGFNEDSFSGELIMLPNIIEPSEGDCFIIDIFSRRQFFQVTQVEQVILKSKPHYVLQYHIGIPDYLPQLNKQVVEEYNAIFDNIGTHDKVVISTQEYNLKSHYIDIYKDMMQYYKNKFFKDKTTTFEIKVMMNDACETIVKYVDTFLTYFMEKERIIVRDELTKSTLMLDYNNLYGSEDYKHYNSTIYKAIVDRDISKLEQTAYIILKQLDSPFALITGRTNEKYYLSDYYSDAEPSECTYNIVYDNSEIIYKAKSNDTSVDESAHSRVMAILVNYFRNTIIMPGYFTNICGELDDLEEYLYIPILLYIIREQIKGITNTQVTI